MKNIKKRSPSPTKVRELDTTQLAAVMGGGLSGEDPYPAWAGVMEPVNTKHLDEFEASQDC